MTFERQVELMLSAEPSEVLLSTSTCLAFITESGWLSVSWPASSGGWDDPHLPREGTRVAPQEIASCSFDNVAITFSMPIALLGDAASQPYQSAIGVVVQHACPETRHSWLGPWDERTAGLLLAALRERLKLPRRLSAPLTPTEAELSEHPHHYHGKLIVAEGRWCQGFEESPDFIANSTLVFPPEIAAPDRARRLRAEGVWIVVSQRPGALRIGPDRVLHARTVEEIPWAATEQQLYPCPSCNRHVQASSRECPFCGAVLPAGPPRRQLPPEEADLLRLAPEYGAPPLRRAGVQLIVLLMIAIPVLVAGWLILSKLLHVF